MLIVLVMILLSGMIFYVVTDYFEESPLSYGPLPFPVQTPVVKPGGTVLVDIRRCNSDVETRYYVVTRKLKSVDGHRDIALPSYSQSMDPGCETLTGLPVAIPSYACGRYVDTGISYIEGRRKHFAIAWASEPFEVLCPLATAP